VKAFEDSGGLVGLETLEYANNEPLRKQADNILDTYFYKDEENSTTVSVITVLLLVHIVLTVTEIFLDSFVKINN